MSRIFSKSALEGYVSIDHRDSPGISHGLASHTDQATRRGTVPVAAGKLFEGATVTCSHCEAVVVKNHDRVRARGYCPKCDRYVCDHCEADRVRSGVCRPFKQVIDEFVDSAAKGHLPL